MSLARPWADLRGQETPGAQTARARSLQGVPGGQPARQEMGPTPSRGDWLGSPAPTELLAPFADEETEAQRGKLTPRAAELGVHLTHLHTSPGLGRASAGPAILAARVAVFRAHAGLGVASLGVLWALLAGHWSPLVPRCLMAQGRPLPSLFSTRQKGLAEGLGGFKRETCCKAPGSAAGMDDMPSNDCHLGRCPEPMHPQAPALSL